MGVDDKIEELRGLIRSGRSMPISASCLVNRKEVLAALDELAGVVPEQLEEAKGVLRERDTLVEEGRTEADRIVEEGRAERTRLLEATDVHREAREAGEAVRAEAQREADGLRREVDDYVDHKLASLEIALNKTLAAVERGQEGSQERARDAAVDPDPSDDAEIAALRQGADDYVRVTFERFEESVRKTLEVVSRGRERLRDRSGLDEFAAGLADEQDLDPLPGD